MPGLVCLFICLPMHSLQASSLPLRLAWQKCPASPRTLARGLKFMVAKTYLCTGRQVSTMTLRRLSTSLWRAGATKILPGTFTCCLKRTKDSSCVHEFCSSSRSVGLCKLGVTCSEPNCSAHSEGRGQTARYCALLPWIRG